MTTALEYLKANPVFHIATVDGTKVRIRLFGFVRKRNGALYFCTNKIKDVYGQLSKNPEIEIMPPTWQCMYIIAFGKGSSVR